MLKNYIKIAWRHILKNRSISAINFTGLVVGMTSVLLIWQYVSFEKSYDKFHENGDRVFRVRTDRMKDGVAFMKFAGGAACAGPVLARNVPEVEDYVKLRGPGESIIYYHEDAKLTSKQIFYAMPSFFKVFTFPLVQGDEETCLKEPFSACITEGVAQKIFGDEDPIGKTIKHDGTNEYRITGILKDPPNHSHLGFEVLLSYSTFSDVFVEGGESETAPYWDGFLTYLLLKPGTDWHGLESKFFDAMEKTYDLETAESTVFSLQPLPDLHLTSNLLGETKPPGDGTAVKFLFLVGSLILIIAWFNYINLATARSELRAREVGVRKVVGSGRGSLIRQFLTEAALINFLAIAASLLLSVMLTPWFVHLIDSPMPTIIFDDLSLLSLVIGTFLLGTFLTGIYPALLLSSHKPLDVLNSGSARSTGGGGSWLRKGLVVFQFVISVGLIASTIVIYNQLQYMQDRDLGLNINQTLVVKAPLLRDSTYRERSETFKAELAQLPGLNSVVGSSSVPGRPIGWTAGISKWGDEENVGFRTIASDRDYADAYDVQIVAGRAMGEEFGSDDQSCMINERGVEVFEYDSPEASIGQEVNFWGDRLTIVGVMKDFHQSSPKAIVEPIIVRPFSERFGPGYFSLKLTASQSTSTVAAVESIYDRVYAAGSPIEYFFLDEHYNKQYASERLFGQVFSLFSGLAIFISCLGLLALIAFVVERKKREIGIRKVLGSSVTGIVSLLSKDFLVLVVIASIIATPLVWHFMNGWLEGFAFRIEMQWWIFGAAIVAALIVTMVTVGYQSLKAATTNPVDSLRGG